MRTKQFFALAMSVFLFANCTQKETDAPLTENTAVVSATIENDDSKSTATDDGFFAWAEGDKIGIHTTDGGFLEGTLSGGVATPNGSFTYSYIGEDTPATSGYAVYPHNDLHSISDGQLYYNIPSVFELGAVPSNTNAAMLAVPEKAKGNPVSYSFSHLAGVMRFVFKNAPAGTDRFTLSLGGQKINGTFSVSLNDEEPSISTGSAGTGEEMTTLEFDALASTQDLTLFVPVPVGKYIGISASLYAGDKVLGSWGTENASNEVNRRSLKLMPPITFSSAGGDINNDVTVADESQLKDAVLNTGTVTLTQNIGLTANLQIPQNTEVVIDLNGNNLDNGTFTIEVAQGSTLTIVNNGEPVAVRSGSSTPSAAITSSGDVIKAFKNSTINIREGVSLTSTENCCIFVPSGADDVTINTSGNLTSSGKYGTVYVNGNVTSGTVNITGGSVTHNDDIAVYVAGKADVNISEGTTITGSTAVEVRAGNLTVTGGSLIATGDPFKADPNGNGSTSVGAAVAVSQHSTDHNVTVKISGGKFEGVRALYEADLENETDSDKIVLSVTGGEFNGEIYSENCAAFIAGGEYSSPASCYYLADNANVIVNMTEDYTGAGFKTNAGQTVSLTMADGVTYTVEAPLVGSAGTQNLGFQFLKGSTVSIKGGTITSADAKMLINNYSDLTLSNIVLAPEVPETMNGQAYYVLSNNCGTVNLESGTTITAPVKEGHTVYAFDVCKYGSYPNVTVNVADGVTVSGDVEYTGQGANQKLIINGGTFSGKLVVADSYKEGAKAGVSVKGGTFSDASWFGYLAASANVSLGASLTIDESLTFDKDATFNLNNCNVTCNKSDVFVVTAGTLTIKGEGVVWGSSDNSSSSCAVWAKENGNVVIKSGTYKVGDDQSNYASGNWRNDCIYARDYAKITIEGGEFEYTGNNLLGHTFLLNCRDEDYKTGNSAITVKGGTFHNFNPEATNSENPVADYLAAGYKSTAVENTYVVTAVQE